MLDGTFQRILARYGQDVELCRAGGVARGRAFLQPVLERREDWKQALPTPLGVVRRDRFLYLGEPGLALEGPGEGFLRCRGTAYEILACQAVWVGEELSHWWAVLRVRDGEEQGHDGVG